ncbi:hypothetical protein KP509_33G006200 [Ceratopteris richardii]|uniref:Phorbol-ester/DAG-type domain-containing protein n=1 Tax=Ceratopteris richardii TaxID=49495 RepID=A0A8T2QLF2_CERRI|nr:hypothetical protein KP509_33G006200 [Ceratopteris richardii]
MPHALTLLPSAYDSQRYLCNLCFELGCGPVYHCSDCNFDLHVLCAAMEPLAYHFTHIQHSLNLMPPYPPTTVPSCDSCGCNIKGWSFRCNECNFDLHTLCARAPRFMRHTTHPHPLELRRQDTRQNFKCSGCGNVLRHNAYVCVHCDFRLHQVCARMADQLKHPLHPDHILQRQFSKCSSGRLRPCRKCGLVVQGWEYCCATCDIHIHPFCADIEEHNLPHSLPISDDLNGRRTVSSAATPAITPHPISVHATRRAIPAPGNRAIEGSQRADLEAVKRIVGSLENMTVSRAEDA